MHARLVEVFTRSPSERMTDWEPIGPRIAIRKREIEQMLGTREGRHVMLAVDSFRVRRLLHVSFRNGPIHFFVLGLFFGFVFSANQISRRVFASFESLKVVARASPRQERKNS